MLLTLLITLALCVLAIGGIVKGIRLAMDRLGLDPMTSLLWLGLAEWPTEAPAPREQAYDPSPAVP